MAELTFKALLVGNGVYPNDPHNLPELKGPQNDLRILEEALVHPQVGLFEKQNVQVLLDNNLAEIMEVTNEFFDSAKRNDQLLFYYSGHGLLDKFNHFYFCTRSTKTNTLIPTAISDDQLNSMIQLSISSHVVIIIDCCHSGRFKASALPQNLQGEGRFVITSSRAKELTKDALEVDQPSAFTKYVAEALLSSEVDSNKDGYISINELYDYVLPRIRKETKQRPHRMFDQAFGELALGKSNADAPRPTTEEGNTHQGRPILSVSTEDLFIDDVEVGEELPVETIDVFNEGGGNLDWTFECENDWIKVDKAKGHIKLTFQPTPGMNRGRVYIRDKNTGQGKRVQIRVRVHESVRPPKLHLSSESIDFGVVSKNLKLPAQSLRLNNLGDGELKARAKAKGDWIEAKLRGDILEVSASTDSEGKFVGSIDVDSAGGSVSVPVRLVVEPGPVLKVTPTPINFLTNQKGATAEKQLVVENTGKGNLEWTFQTKGSFFTAKRRDDEIDLVLDTSDVGKFQGSVFITSNGGEKTVPVRAMVKDEYGNGDPDFVDISGVWESAGGVANISGPGPIYQYQSTNAMGVIVEQGTAQVAGNTVTLQVYNMLMGNLSATLSVHGNTMSGSMTTPGGIVPFTAQRSNAAPLLNLFANLFN